MRVNHSKGRKKYSTDRMMRNVALSLIRDFQENLDQPQFCENFYEAINRGSIEEIRGNAPAPDESMSVAEYKATYQLASVFKRYRFEKDLYSDAELREKAVTTFLETQQRICAIDLDLVDSQTTKVLEYARIYIANTLGKYNDETHRSLCRFGSKASVGVPSSKACEAARWEIPISGSSEQVKWFDSEMSRIPVIQEYLDSQKGSDLTRSTYHEISSLKLTLVPKTFKAFRAIMPNTTIGSYQSYGLGELMRISLKRKGFDIRRLQHRHRILAREASMHNMYTTADLSSASDSISVALVERLFPADWFEILNRSRIGTVVLPGNLSVDSLTFCTMGIGFTFPLQTLVFLSLLKAIEATLYHRWNRRMISVYGDDMIYSSSMHSTVMHVFEQIGFVINIDKTFHEGYFRESCGGDYYRGVDVRPFQPRNGSASVSPKAYEAMLYKYVNCLLARWSEHEIGRTLRYLCNELEEVAGTVKLVPEDYPDDSGVKCPTLRHWEFLQCIACSSPKHIGHGVYRFSFLRLVPNERKEVRHGPYMWAKLRGITPGDAPYHHGHIPEATPSFYLSVIDYVTGASREKVECFITRDAQPIKTYRHCLTGRRLRLEDTFVTIVRTGTYMRRIGFSRFENRR